jgi:predicted AAA+ superfamily ATPase
MWGPPSGYRGYDYTKLQFHFRTSAGHEVDVILENRRHELVAIEIKASATVGESDFRGLRGFAELVGKRLRTGVLLYAGRDVLPFGNHMWAVPIDSLWSGAT